MCMLTYFPENAMPDRDALLNGAAYNDDGHGFAIVSNGKLIIRKSMDGVKLVDAFLRERAKHPSGPALFHSRIGTAGPNDLSNCHPFRVKFDRRTVVAHNGILPTMVQPWKGDRRSDTRVFTDEFLPAIDPMMWTSTAAVVRMEKWLGHNKILLLSVNPDYPRQAILFNEELGYWDAGVWYSNKDYQGGFHHLYSAYGKSTSYYSGTGGSLSVIDDADEHAGFLSWDHRAAWGVGGIGDTGVDEYGERLTLGHAPTDDVELPPITCSVCGSERIDIDTGICDICLTCVDCGQDYTRCQCYIPVGKDRRDARGLNPDVCDDAPWWSEAAKSALGATRTPLAAIEAAPSTDAEMTESA